MLLLKYILLGFIQGVTEALPISSSGHLLIFKTLLNVDVDFDTLAIITNAGSLLAVVIIFWKDIVNLISSFFNYLKTKDEKYKSDYNYCWLIVIGCIPAGIIGLLVKKFDVFSMLENNVKIVGLSLLITALMLFVIKDFKGKKEKNDMKVKDTLTVGLFQVLGVFPGISRSGSTIVGGMATGLKRDTAFKYSFMLYIPISLAATLVELKDLFSVSISSTLWLYYGVATIIAFIFTALCIKWFRKIVNEGKLLGFVYYCLIVGLLVIMFL